jgi:hypothetical protein
MLEKLRNAVLLVIGGLAAVWAISGLVGVVQGGDMEPWAPPGPTYKNLRELEPRTAIWQPGVPGSFPIVISQPGSYYLAEDIYGEAGANGIEIWADDVTLDLNGFTVKGVAGSGHGIAVPAGAVVVTNLSIHDGFIRDWDGDGICAASPCAATGGGAYRDLEARDNAGAGLRVGLRSSLVRVIADTNGGAGIYADLTSTLSDCVANGNADVGIRVNTSILNDCVSKGNTTDGIQADWSAVSGCLVMGNGENGIEVGTNSVVVGNDAHDNGGSNLNYANINVTSSDNRIEGNNLSGSAWNIKADTGGGASGNVIIKNSASGNNNYSLGTNTAGPIETSATPLTNPWANIAY